MPRVGCSAAPTGGRESASRLSVAAGTRDSARSRRRVPVSYTHLDVYKRQGQNRSQTSRGQITDVGLAPERFGDKYRSEVAAHFNRAQGKVTFSANTPDAPLLTGAQDRLSVLVQLGALVASEPQRYGPGTTLTIQTIGPRDALSLIHI